MAATPLAGKTAVLTGGTSGIGQATAIGLALAGARLILIARSPARVEETIRQIREAKPDADVRSVIADLASLRSIETAAEQIRAEEAAIQVLVNNAAVVNLARETTEDGIEANWGVNHLGYFALTLRLLDRLRAGAPARIINVASDAHKFVKGLQFDDLEFEQGYSSLKVYGHSKLANILFTQELARRLTGDGITVNCLHPGAVATNLGGNNGAWARMLLKVISPIMKTPERAARTPLHLATAPEVADVTGEYFVGLKAKKLARHARDEEAARRLFEISEETTGLRFERSATAVPT